MGNIGKSLQVGGATGLDKAWLKRGRRQGQQLDGKSLDVSLEHLTCSQNRDVHTTESAEKHF